MNKMEIKFSACTQNESFARAAVAGFCLSLNPTLEELNEIKTIVSEGVSNAIIHGYNYDSSKYVFVKACVFDNIIEITIQDYGVGIEDVSRALEDNFTTKPEEERLGMGMSIMRTLSDDFSVRSFKDIGTRLLIKKEFKKNYQEVK